MSRPTGALRILSTNVGATNPARPLEGKLAIVTGGSRGIGAAICHNLASKGCSLLFNYTSDSSSSLSAELASELESTHGVRVKTIQADMGSESGPRLIISTAKNHFSHPKTSAFQIDIIINNAGVPFLATLGNIASADFHRVYAINVLGPLLLMQEALPYLPNDRSGRIVNVSSVSASCGFTGQSVYGGTKAALDAMTRTWARELAERATVNSINPGPVNTKMFKEAGEDFYEGIRPFVETAPLMKAREGLETDEVMKIAERLGGGRPAYEHEIAGIVGMLCGEESGWCTGSVVNANGGFTFQL
ncbi:MAG: hypothetical protein M1823_005041 [Watsoniomyces obsoletus]|nr:MAG: hypothetical protein M1823_005041 [Watsoniomyces obsoletus]